MQGSTASPSPKLNFLIAIPYCKDEVIEYLQTIQDNCVLLLDSGAFTAWKKGKTVGLEEYKSFISKCPLKLWRYFTCDVVGHADATNENYRKLLADGFKPIPIFTRGDNIEMVDEYYSTSDLIAVGGLVGTRGNRGFVKGIMEHIGVRPVHWLGFTNGNYLATYRPFSCDSSSWSMALRYGTCDLYIGKGRWKRFKRQDFLRRPSCDLMALFEQYEEDPTQFRFETEWKNTGRSGADKKLLARIAYKSWARYQIEVERTLGVKFFLSCGEIAQFWLFKEAHDFWLGKITRPVA